jgi:hypothetical protein
MSGCSNAAKFRAALELIPVDDVLYACSARTGVPIADGHFKFLRLWPPQNPPLDAIVMV